MRMRRAGRPPRMRPVRLAHPSSSRAFRVAAVAAVVAGAGVTAGSAAAAGQEAVSLRLGYTCAFPSGSRPVSTLVSATFPAAGTAGQPIRPTGTGIAVTLPRAAVADLARLNAAAVTLTASLRTKVTEGTTSATAIWRDLRSPATAIPRKGPLTLTASGSAPPVTAAGAGEVTVTASGLTLGFTAGPRQPTSPANSQPSPANSQPSPANSQPSPANSQPASPARVWVACVPRAGQDTTLARIAVAAPAPARATTPAPPGDNPAKCLPFPKGLKLNPRFPLPKPLPGSRAFHAPQPGCAYSTGYTNARKLHEAALVGPGLADLELGLVTFTKFTSKYSYFQQRVAGQLEYHGRPVLPPARATLLGFGFVPVSATIQISEIGSLNLALISCAPTNKCPNPPPKNVALFFGLVTLRISHVAVNGVPLNVGPHCQTATPFNLVLTGVPPAYNVSLIQGVLTGTVTIPPFKGCMNGTDNLDPIFTATVSGPGNFVKVTQAPICTPTTGGGCPPVKPVPKH
jgi:hypothetical protein